jgi:magnesium-transporting ATPase (P-type)
MQAPDWHSRDVFASITALNADLNGLSALAAASRLAAYRPNRLAEAAKPNPLLRFVRHFQNILIYVLLGSALIAASLDHYVDIAVILTVVIANAVIGFIQ